MYCTSNFCNSATYKVRCPATKQIIEQNRERRKLSTHVCRTSCICDPETRGLKVTADVVLAPSSVVHGQMTAKPFVRPCAPFCDPRLPIACVVDFEGVCAWKKSSSFRPMWDKDVTNQQTWYLNNAMSSAKGSSNNWREQAQASDTQLDGNTCQLQPYTKRAKKK